MSKVNSAPKGKQKRRIGETHHCQNECIVLVAQRVLNMMTRCSCNALSFYTAAAAWRGKSPHVDEARRMEQFRKDGMGVRSLSFPVEVLQLVVHLEARPKPGEEFRKICKH